MSYNKFLAKIASDINKPNGLKVILPKEAEAFLEALSIEKFHGIGKVTAQKMRSLGIHRGYDLKQWSEEALYHHFGKTGRYFYKIVRGTDDRLVNPERIRKSLGAERTFDYDLENFGSIGRAYPSDCSNSARANAEERHARLYTYPQGQVRGFHSNLPVVSRRRLFNQQAFYHSGISDGSVVSC